MTKFLSGTWTTPKSLGVDVNTTVDTVYSMGHGPKRFSVCWPGVANTLPLCVTVNVTVTLTVNVTVSVL
jgi:hypothetical protein